MNIITSRWQAIILWTYVGILFFLVPIACRGTATNRYVATNAPASAWPYDSWTSAATNIKYAVDAANSNNAGDLVIVSNGTYYLTEQITVSNVIVTNYSGNWSLTTINGNYSTVTTRCFFLNHPNAVISGFTITNGYATNSLAGNGGGIYVEQGRVHDCLVTGCRSVMSVGYSRGGGGIYVKDGTVSCSSVIGNVFDSRGSALTLAGGGGVYAASTNAMVTNCVIALNLATNSASGGGLAMLYALGLNCTIVSNYADRYGGGCVLNSNSSLKNSVIASNACFYYGGGIQIMGGATIYNCLISRNKSTWQWGYCGGVYVNGPCHMSGCTIVSNLCRQGGGGGGISFDFATGCKTNISNCIIRMNQSLSGHSDLYDANNGPNKTSIMFSCVSSGSGFTIESVVTNDPSFESASNGNYRLRNDSPCINAGINESWMINAYDLSGVQRIRYGIVDMGCFERLNQGTAYFVH